MATTLTLQNSMNFVQSIIKNQAQMVNNDEPAVTAANVVLGTMLGPPCKWRFNRKATSFAVSAAGGTDYVKNLPLFGFLDVQSLVDADGNQYELGGATSLVTVATPGQPDLVAPQFDDNAGNITFRLNKVPDQGYTVFADYQMKMALMTSSASNWGVVPDEFAYCFTQGFTSLMMLLINDSRFPIFQAFFLDRLLGAQDGLTEQQRDIFARQWMAFAGTLVRSQAMVNQGTNARGK